MSRHLGQMAEDRVCAWLQGEGWQLIARNFTIRGGEIDLIMRQNRWLVFFEVRCRQDMGYGSMAESIDSAKQRCLCRAASTFLQKNPQFADCNLRFDVVLLAQLDGEPEWIRHAFECE